MKYLKRYQWYIFIFLGIIGNHQNIFGQENSLNHKVSIEFTNVTVIQALKQLGIKTDCFFNYANSKVDNSRRISKIYKEERLETIIKKIWGNSNIQIKASGRIIDIKSVEKNFSIKTSSIKGKILDISGLPISLANITINDGAKYTISNENGDFIVENLQSGSYQIKISAIGFYTDIRSLNIAKDISLKIILKEKIENLENITIYGKTETQKQNEKAITISSIDVKKLKNQSVGTEEVLKTTTGVVIRQNGGLGSAVKINLNGLTGEAVRSFYDGIPIDIYGGGIDLNTIPVDALERIDVYKGIMPIDIGTDALGGGINLVPLKQNREYLRTSYSIGSFNTHRVTFTGLKNINDKMSLSTISYFNYSDNDYEMKNIRNQVELSNGLGVSEEIINVKRFHDQHISGFLELKFRIKNLKWADRLEFASSYAARKNEIQHGAFISQTAIGEAEVEANSFTQRMDYRKTFFQEKINVRYYGILSSAFEKINDNSINAYDWRGNILNRKITSELSSRPTLRERENLGTAHRLILDYKILDNINFKASNFYQYTKTQGKDPLAELTLIENEFIDLNTIPSTINRNIFGVELNAHFFDNKLDVLTFFKNYTFNATSIDVFRLGVTTLPVRNVSKKSNGYGFGLKYTILPNLFVRTSFEQAIRMPTEVEFFGDLGTTLPNFELQPEESSNWNLGLRFEKRFKNEKSFLIGVNGFFRNQENLIRPVQFNGEQVQFQNEDSVDGKGIELNMSLVPLKNLTLKGNYTQQSNQIAIGPDKEKEVPNIPLQFYNLGANYTLENIFKTKNSIQFFWNYLFTDKFSINTIADINNATSVFLVPKQHIHNTGLTYIIKEKGLAISFNLKNVLNTEAFDNFRIPRPGINYAFKINYSL